ncbi:hypothetical protein TanjilG_11442 [Lupinus angustifolius]|uniref:Uncharacterized protein n=1 Tax=Lupinus angustifolius TaxID=3871 RepID=A0A1J7HY38_LUPAN|nr:hypothetical protein TanjilG_11442 [Lupinus angustifolius]
MAPITTYLMMCISSIFYILWDAHLAIEDFTHQNLLLFPLSTMGYGLTHPDLPILL